MAFIKMAHASSSSVALSATRRTTKIHGHLRRSHYRSYFLTTHSNPLASAKCSIPTSLVASSDTTISASQTEALSNYPRKLPYKSCSNLSNHPAVWSTRRNRPFSSEAQEVPDLEDDLEGTSTRRYVIQRRQGVRNVAIVAHVDHGKTTLVDELLKVAASSITSTFSSNGDTSDSSNISTTASEGQSTTGEDESGQKSVNLERLMDSGELEKERGITITSKVTRLDYRSEKMGRMIVNVVDTPGHSDFSGEVDRILSTVDGVVLVIDAAEGPKSQTKYVLSRALHHGLRPIVVLNKVDREGSLGRLEGGEVEMEVLDLFEHLLEGVEYNGESIDLGDYRTMFGSARSGWISDDVDEAIKVVKDGDAANTSGMKMTRLLDAILDDIPPPSVHWYGNYGEGSGGDKSPLRQEGDFESEPFSMTATTVGYDNFLGRTCTGRIYSGKVKAGDSITLLPRQDKDGSISDKVNSNTGSGQFSIVSGVFANRGVSRVPLDPPTAYAGDIVTLTGVPEQLNVGDTLTSTKNKIEEAIDTPPLAPPTLSCLFGSNNGPLAGREGMIVTSSRIKARLISETDNNVTLTVKPCELDAEKTIVLGRGELQIGILVEQMRREGFELIITPPQILTHTCPTTGETIEPYEEVIVDVDAEYSGAVVNALTGPRRGVLVEMSDETSDGKSRLKFEVPSRGLLGFGPEVSSMTRGTAVMHHCFLEDRPYAGAIGTGVERGKLISNEMGKATLFALESLSARGTLFVAPGEMVYPGMVIGENSKSNDLEVNPVRAKATSNMRTQAKDEKLYLPPPKRMSVEELIGYMDEDEVIEVTPQSVRLRKLELDSNVRERMARTKKKQMDALRQANNPRGGKK